MFGAFESCFLSMKGFDGASFFSGPFWCSIGSPLAFAGLSLPCLSSAIYLSISSSLFLSISFSSDSFASFYCSSSFDFLSLSIACWSSSSLRSRSS